MNGRPIPFARQLSVCPMPTINGEHKAQESPKLLYFADQIIKKTMSLIRDGQTPSKSYRKKEQ